MAYADFDYYSNDFLGFLIPAAQFGYYAARASEYLDNLTLDQIPSPVPEAVRLACCSVAEVCYRLDTGGRISAEKAGDYSVSYEKAGTEGSRREQLRQAAMVYLADTGLVYRGVQP